MYLNFHSFVKPGYCSTMWYSASSSVLSCLCTYFVFKCRPYFPSYSLCILNFPYFIVGCFQVLFDFLCNYKLDVYGNSLLYVFTGIPFCISRNLIRFYLLTDYVGIYQVNRTFCVVYHFLWKNKWSYSSKLGDYCFLTYLWPCRFHFLFR